MLAKNTHGMSRIILILVLLITFILGVVLSYVYNMGYYAPSEFRLPKDSAITIESVEISQQDTRFFNVTVLNPSYSPSDVNITRIETRTADNNRTNVMTEISPGLPFPIKRGQSQKFKATWNWANYTDIQFPYSDKPVEIRVLTEDGRGVIYELVRPLVTLTITDVEFNPAVSVEHFNLTVQNSQDSQTYVNITSISLGGNIVSLDKVNPDLPYTLSPGANPVKFQCFFNWIALMNQSQTIGVNTLQGYVALRPLNLPQPVVLSIPEVIFNAAISTQEFNMSVTNSASSPSYVDVNRITVAVNQLPLDNITQWTAHPSSRLEKNSSTTIVCSWNWSNYAGQSANAKITLYTSQGFVISKETQIP